MTTGVSMTKPGVIAHRDKRFDGGLGEFRDLLEAGGWTLEADGPGVRKDRRPESSKINRVPDGFRKMIDGGVACVLMSGGDITVRRSTDATVGDGVDHVSLGILPAGTANLVAESLHIPVDLEAAADTALRSQALAIDVGR